MKDDRGGNETSSNGVIVATGISLTFLQFLRVQSSYAFVGCIIVARCFVSFTIAARKIH